MTQYVQFADETEMVVVSVFCGPQDPAEHNFLGEVADDDPRYLAFVSPPPDLLAINSAKLRELVKLAASQKSALSNRIADLEFSIEDGTAAPGEDAELVARKAKLVLWFRYSSSLGRVTAQSGWFTTVVWPVQPAEGMDLSVSSTSPDTF